MVINFGMLPFMARKLWQFRNVRGGERDREIERDGNKVYYLHLQLTRIFRWFLPLASAREIQLRISDCISLPPPLRWGNNLCSNW